MNPADADILSVVRSQFPAEPPSRLGVAVSGGGDSIALLHILTRCFEPGQVALFAATVDHGLRPEAASEAAFVADFCASLGLPHTTLRWRDSAATGNLQDQARRARYDLMAEWAKSQQIATLALGHTANDQAETVLMRLARASGVTGLAAMPVRRCLHGITLLRPMLDVSRADLRDYLVRADVAWVDDPSNDDETFDRIKARRALKALSDLGVTVQGLTQVARNMAQARDALDWYSFLAAREVAQVSGGDLVLDLRKFRTLPEEIARRLMVQAIHWISGSEYPPRRAAMEGFLTSIRQGRSATLNGCRAVRFDGAVCVFREYNAVRSLCSAPDEIWDGRWRLHHPNRADGSDVRALGRGGLAQCPDWRTLGRPHAALISSPSVWSGDTLVSAPLAGWPNGWTAELLAGDEDFYAGLLSH